MVLFLMEVPMNTITITLSDDRLAKLQEMATRFRVSPEELVRVGVEELLARPENDTFQRAVTDVLRKNAELYRRLA
jgi:predicted transcriptional regulator